MTDFSDLDDFENVKTKTEKEANFTKHPCQSCAGTGKWSGPIEFAGGKHQDGRCFSCNGRGWFKTSAANRLKARKSAAKSKARAKADKIADATAAFYEADERNEKLIETLVKMSDWNDFARSLLAGFSKYGSLTDNQTAAAHRMVAKVTTQAVRTTEQAAEGGEVGVAAIDKLFETASSNGLKKPRFVTEHLIISKAPDSGRNAGSLYVKRNGDYVGKITAGEFLPWRAPEGTLELLTKIACDPIGAATEYGRSTGNCSCCNRKLTDPVSVANGIGPVCATKWGL